MLHVKQWGVCTRTVSMLSQSYVRLVSLVAREVGMVSAWHVQVCVTAGGQGVCHGGGWLGMVLYWHGFCAKRPPAAKIKVHQYYIHPHCFCPTAAYCNNNEPLKEEWLW